MGEKKKQTRQALYRKYRSKSLDEIIGQEHITKTLSNALKQGKISHAYLFTGPRGTGKTSIARILAHEINQLPYTDESTHLDIIEIDAASNRRIDDIRDLRDKVHIAPLSVKYKVYIIDEVHMLTTESFNALLKTLEEPPEHVVFMLATTEFHKLPATIISRTQRHSLKTIPEEQVTAHLKTIAEKENIAITKEALELIALHGNGSFRDSISLLDQLSTHSEEVTVDVVQHLLGLAPSSQLTELHIAIASGDTKLVLEQVNGLLSSGLTPSGIATQLSHAIREKAAESSATSKDIKLLSELLKVHGSIFQKLTLETTLLAAATESGEYTEPVFQSSKPSTPKPAQVAQSPSIAEKAPQPQATQATETLPKIQDSKEVKLKKTLKSGSNVDFDQHWQQVLQAIKIKNNPLYTVMRLAKFNQEGDVLTFSFAFGFHQKRIDETKNKIIIAETIREVTGHEFTVETSIDKSLNDKNVANFSATEPAPDPAHASVIDSVRDMMGGGEVVNV